MKKIISVLLTLIMLFSLASIAFAGSWQEEEAYKEVRVYGPDCDNCSGTFGRDHSTNCPNYVNENGVAVNIGEYSGCRVDSYFDIDEIDKEGNIIHKGDLTTHYYWKAKCCEDCTGKFGCKCNNTDNKDACGCPYCEYTPDHTDEKIEEGLEKGKQGYIHGIQTALKAVREVMYNLFDELFKFLRLDDVLGKWPGRQQ